MGFNCGGVEKTTANRQQEVSRLVAGSSPVRGANKIRGLEDNKNKPQEAVTCLGVTYKYRSEFKLVHRDAIIRTSYWKSGLF